LFLLEFLVDPVLNVVSVACAEVEDDKEHANQGVTGGSMFSYAAAKDFLHRRMPKG